MPLNTVIPVTSFRTGFRALTSLNKKPNYVVMEYFFRYAEQLSNGDEVLIQKNFELSPEKVINVSDIIMTGKNPS